MRERNATHLTVIAISYRSIRGHRAHEYVKTCLPTLLGVRLQHILLTSSSSWPRSQQVSSVPFDIKGSGGLSLPCPGRKGLHAVKGWHIIHVSVLWACSHVCVRTHAPKSLIPRLARGSGASGGDERMHEDDENAPCLWVFKGTSVWHLSLIHISEPTRPY